MASPVAHPHEASELENVVVFVKAKPIAAPTPMRAAVRQKNEVFLPHVVAVTTGSTVAFPNDDLFFHNVFSLSGIATFDLGRYPRGESRERTFTKPGIVKVFCHLHSHMTALVRVFDHPYFAIPDPTGRFEISGLDAGQYEIVAWHERVGEQVRAVTVIEGQVASVSFSLPIEDE